MSDDNAEYVLAQINANLRYRIADLSVNNERLRGGAC